MRKYAMAMKFLAVRNPLAGSFGLLQQAVHGLHIGVAATVQHPAHDRIESFAQGLGQFSERLQAAAPRPTQPALQFLAGMLLSLPAAALA